MPGQPNILLGIDTGPVLHYDPEEDGYDGDDEGDGGQGSAWWLDYFDDDD